MGSNMRNSWKILLIEKKEVPDVFEGKTQICILSLKWENCRHPGGEIDFFLYLGAH